MTIKKAYETSGKIFEQVSAKSSPGMFEQLKAIKEGEIIVVRGTYDHIETLMDILKVPYGLIGPEEITKNNGGRVMFVNCHTYGNSEPRKNWVKEFVEDGGRLVTTDWAISLVSNVFPGRLTKTKKTSDDVVEVQCNTDIARRFLGLNYAQCHPKWWLEGSSDVYDIGQKVVPIITSEEMKEKYGKEYIASAFTEGKGEVVHFISHLELQRTHLRNKYDKGGLEDFLEKMKVEILDKQSLSGQFGTSSFTETKDLDDADDLKVAELEAAYSTLNTLAYLCIPAPILNMGMKSVVVGSAKSAMKSKGLM